MERGERRKLPWRWALRTGAALLALVALLAAAWVVSNWNDADPLPRPPDLLLAAAQLDEANNAFFALVGVHAQQGRNIAAAGQTVWRSSIDFASLPQAQKSPEAAGAWQRNDSDALGEMVPRFSGPPAVCQANDDDCTAAWIGAADALAAQRVKTATAGARCEALLDESFEFEEVLPPRLFPGVPMASHGSGAASCSGWLLSGAVLAWTRGDPALTLQRLAQADRLNRALLAGSRSLIGQVIAWSLSRRGLRVMTELGVRDPALAASMAPLLMPWPDASEAARRWMAVEAAFQQEAFGDVSATCLTTAPTVEPSFGDAMLAWLCRHRIGWHPQRSRQAIDRVWLDRLQALRGGLPAAIEQMQGEHSASRLRWRNTIGERLLDLSRPAYGDYLARQADLDLHREAAALALAAQTARIPAAQRAAWSAGQPLSDSARERLAWNEAGTVLQARTWYGGQGQPRFAIRVAWPNAAKP
jgi:hypothetical protein